MRTRGSFSVCLLSMLTYGLLVSGLILLSELCVVVGEDIAEMMKDENDVEDVAGDTNATMARSKEDSFADMIDRALEKEFPENEHSEGADPGSFNNSVAGQQAVLETVARVRTKKNETEDDKSFQLHMVFNLDTENRGDDTPMLIDRKDNVFIISNPKSKYPVLQLDLREKAAKDAEAEIDVTRESVVMNGCEAKFTKKQ